VTSRLFRSALLADGRQFLASLLIHTHLHYGCLQHDTIECIVQFVSQADECLSDQSETYQLLLLALERFAASKESSYIR